MLVIAAAVIGIVLFGIFSESEHKEQPMEKAEVVPLSYPTAPVELTNPTYEISVPAEVKPNEQVAIYARITGFVKKLVVDRGDQVKKGQLLAVLQAPEMEQQYLSDKSTEKRMQSDYLFAKQAYERMIEASATTGAVAAIELDRARTSMESAAAAYKASKAGAAHTSQMQQYLRITAPFDGIITQRNVSTGALAGPGSEQPLFEMAQHNKLRLTLSLPEKHAASVTNGAKASFTVSSRPGKVFNAELSRTSGLLVQKDRSLKLEFDVDNASGELQGGEYAQVKLTLRRSNPTFWVPSESLLYTQSGTYIMTLNNNEIKKIRIREGIRMETFTEVFGELFPEDSVLLKPSEEIPLGEIAVTHSNNKLNY